MIKRCDTKVVKVGGVQVGGSNHVVIQSMTNTNTCDVFKTVEQINELKNAGCEIVRLAIVDMDAAKAFGEIRKKVDIPMVCDIHFDYRLALECINGGADKVRINPGNIGGRDNVKAVVDACKGRRIPIRIGVNMGSIDRSIVEEYGYTAEAMVKSAWQHIGLLNECDFDDIVISLKASSVSKTVEAYRLMASECSYPLHLGVTEAGTTYSGCIKSAMGIGALLLDGIGDTIRVSLTANPVEEIHAAKEILKSAGIAKYGVELVSCPSCGRCKIDQVSLASKVEEAVRNINKNIKVAVMGCVVNGPGEARDADIGVAGGDGCAILFKKGEIVRKIPEDEIVEILIREIEEL